MPRKTIIIFITAFIIVGGLMLGFYYYTSKQSGTTGGTTIGTKGYTPFGTGSSTGTDGGITTNPDGTNTPIGEEVPNPAAPVQFHKITNFAVAGATYFEDMRPIVAQNTALDATATAPVVATPAPAKTTKGVKVTTKPTIPAPKYDIVPSIKYVERATGHIYQMYLDTKATNKISNTTIPSISDVLFDSTAQSIIYRYISSDTNSISSFIASSTVGSKSEFLPSNITDISLSGDKTKYFYLSENSNGVTATIRSFVDSKSTQVWNSPFTEWVSQWVGKDRIFLTTKASYGVNGNTYSLNINSGSLTKVWGGVRGLTTLANSDGSQVLYSSSATSEPKLGILDVKRHTTSDLNTYGLADKCVWSADDVNLYCAVPDRIDSGQYPDDWYQGLVSFNDSFVKINSISGSVTTIADSGATEPVDGIKLFLDKSETNLFFINKKDSTLWSLDLK